MTEAATKLIASNKQARHNYFLSDFLEVGIQLRGTEVKSLRAGKVNFKDAWVNVHNGELWLEGLHIDHYSHGNLQNHEPERRRKLLAHKGEIERMDEKTTEKNMTLVPVRLYFKDGKIKVEIAVAQGKKLHDKRASIAEREKNKTIERTIKNQRHR